MAFCQKCDMENCEHTLIGSSYDYFAGYDPNRSDPEPTIASDHAPRRGCRHEHHGPTIESKFNGWCKGCGTAFDPGTVITYDTERDGWVAGCCT